MHDRVGPRLGEQSVDPRAIADIGLDEAVTGMVDPRRAGIGGVGQLVDVDHLMGRLIEQVANDRRPNEASAASNQDTQVRCPHSIRIVPDARDSGRSPVIASKPPPSRWADADLQISKSIEAIARAGT